MDNNQTNILDIPPNRYIDYSSLVTTRQIQIGKIVTIKGKIHSLKNTRTKRGLTMQIGSLADEAGKIQVIWFNQPFLVKALYPGREVALSGKVSLFSGRPALVSPEYEILTSRHETVHTGRLVPVYPETKYISSKRIRFLIRKKFETEIANIEEYLPPETLKKYKLVEIKKAYRFVHFPKNIKEAEAGRRRLAFNELLQLHLKSKLRKLKWQKKKVAHKLIIDHSAIQPFIDSLPFKLTSSQQKAVSEILQDLSQEAPMNRLLEGDVGSGKTVVAAIAAFATYLNGCQSVLMAPTQILAEQHYTTFTKLFANIDKNIKISLITATSHQSPVTSHIIIGTHALIHKKAKFNKVALVIIDEQHRFGVEQRGGLVKKATLSASKGGVPHILTMTATPIPRTIALTTYGDLDLSVLTDLPADRQKVTTWLVPPQKRVGAYNWIQSQITSHQSQAFWICPLIEESEKETMKDIKAVTSEFLNLKTQMSNVKIGLLHGRMKASEKNQVLNDFRTGKLDILVSTPVVEVGIDIPNATIMAIEDAERFGLAQLHQLRGRVGRGKKKSYCLLFGKPSKRLTAMTKMHSGFELAELDLKLRGPGEIFGTAQSGFPQFKAASLSDWKMIKQSKELAEEIAKNPLKYPAIRTQFERASS